MPKWLITGGAGFIGCHAAARFHEEGDLCTAARSMCRPPSRDSPATRTGGPGWTPSSPSFPVAHAAHRKGVLFPHAALLRSRSDMDDIVAAFAKVLDNLAQL